jgi:ectoine hydroxylase
MRLDREQLERFEHDGYLYFPGLFAAGEIDVLRGEVPTVQAQRRPETVREKGRDAFRTSSAAHRWTRPFATLARQPRLVEPVMQMFGEPVYMHQFKIKGKMAFDGDVWQWHQDFGTWRNDDDMPEPRATYVAIFLDAVDEFNGPLTFIPGSHRLDVLDAAHDAATTSYPLWTVDHDTIRRLTGRGGIVASKGPTGSTILFHPCLVHASTSNLSLWNRVRVCLSLCAVSNPIRGFRRPEYIAHREFTPIARLPDDCPRLDCDMALRRGNDAPESALQLALAA